MKKVIFTRSLLTNYSTLEDLKNHFYINNNINILDYLNETYEITTNNNHTLDKRFVIYGAFLSILKLIQAMIIFILK